MPSSAHQTIALKIVLILAYRVILTGVTAATPKGRGQETVQVRWEEEHGRWPTSTEAAPNADQAYSGKR